MCNLQIGPILLSGRLLGLDHAHVRYMIWVLWNRGLRNSNRLVEGLEVAIQKLAMQLLPEGRTLPEDPRACRRVLDHAVYEALKELRPCGLDLIELEFVGTLVKDRRREAADDRDLAARGRGVALRRAVEQLPAPNRLLAKLKFAGVFFPAWETDDLFWDADEVEFLLSLHGGRTLAEVNQEFRVRVQQEPNRQRERVPSAVIAWLLKRSSADAVDSAFYVINRQLKNVAPPGAAFVSKAVAANRGAELGHVNSQRVERNAPRLASGVLEAGGPRDRVGHGWWVLRTAEDLAVSFDTRRFPAKTRLVDTCQVAG